MRFFANIPKTQTQIFFSDSRENFIPALLSSKPCIFIRSKDKNQLFLDFFNSARLFDTGNLCFFLKITTLNVHNAR